MAMPPLGGWPAAPNRMVLNNAAQPPKKPRFRRKKDLGKPRRPVTAYDVFFRNTYPALKEKRPDLTQQQLFAEVGRIWREGTTWQDRQICYDYSDWEKDAYDKQMIEWRAHRKMQKDQEEKLKIKKENINAEVAKEDEDAESAAAADQCRQQ